MGFPDEDRPISYPPVLAVLGRDHEQTWREKAHEQVTRADNSLADKATFGGLPAAQTFATVYAAAVAEYTATLRGAQADLVTAAENLARAAEEMRNRDEDAGAAFVTLLGRWTDPEGFQSNQNREEAREGEQAQQGATTMAGLTADDGQGGGPQGGEDGTSPVVATEPTGPAPTMTTDQGAPASGPNRPA